MFVIRKVKNGKVLIAGKLFVPENRHHKYDGRLEGMSLAFGLYKHCESHVPFITYCGRRFLSYVCMWGTEAEYKDCRYWKEGEDFLDESHLYTLEDGCLPWMFWRTE